MKKATTETHETPVQNKYTDTQVTIAASETPAIQKNKKMRSGRRSSLSLRGKRVSEAFNGLCRIISLISPAT